MVSENFVCNDFGVDNQLCLYAFYVPTKIDYLFWQACYLLKLEPEQDFEWSCYTFLCKQINTVERYTCFDVYTTSDGYRKIIDKLYELKCQGATGWLLDILEDEEE